jgi:hypothetical protein
MSHTGRRGTHSANIIVMSQFSTVGSHIGLH